MWISQHTTCREHRIGKTQKRLDRSCPAHRVAARWCALGALMIGVVTTQSFRPVYGQIKDQINDPADAPESRDTEKAPAFETELIRGKVVWQAEALKSEFGISSVPEVAEHSLAILTPDGQLIPIVENLRGRAFRKDERLREMQVEILARRHKKQPSIQILRLYQIDKGQRFEVDYWCDVCAIVMYETGPCACCQDDNRLRRRRVESDDDSAN